MAEAYEVCLDAQALHSQSVVASQYAIHPMKLHLFKKMQMCIVTISDKDLKIV